MTVIGYLLLGLLVIGGTEAQADGRSCVTPNGQQGSCISFLKCPAIRALIPQVAAGIIPFSEIRKTICHIGRIPLVCCAVETTTNNPISTFNPGNLPSGHTRGGLALLPRNCGIQGIVDRIIAGQPAPLGAWPWIVLLRGNVGGRSAWHCGGTLITDQYVLTAAHCVREEVGIQLAFVRIGEHSLSNNPDCSFGVCAPQPQDITVERIIRHPSYNIPCNECNDLALLRLSRKVNLSPNYVMPVCLPVNPVRDMGFSVHEFQGKAAWAAGWGTTSQDPRRVTRPDVLQQVQLPINDLPFCESWKRSYPDQSMVMCAGGEGRRDTCRGDSGGPLTLTDNVGTKYYLVGVTSKGPSICGAQGSQGLYTSVHHYIPWIISNLQP